ncbi:hypothetical protein DYB32_009812 [Aphanomyces invadans]|uniref:Uncharacterized protein n=1 Tax=Aphanomyces invadans TaxID=157072 RepID=A0A3R6YS12_9STRA|nr:hypothetical protein DYB32_009812 [Aphanomyces invadans]
MAERQEKKRRIEAYICPDDAAIKREPELVYLELRALQSKETTLGPTHPGSVATTTSKRLFTIMRRDYRNTHQARQPLQVRQALQSHRVFNRDDVCRSLDRPADTIQSLRRALSINIFNFGELHVDTAILRSNLAAALFTSRHVDPGYVEEGVVLLQTALHVLSDSPYVVRISTPIQLLTQRDKVLDGTYNVSGKPVHMPAVFGATYGTDHEKVLGLHLALATKYIAEVGRTEFPAKSRHVGKRRFDEGESVFRQCADVAMKKHGRVHRTKTFLESLQILLVLYDASHVDIIRGHNNLAMVTIAMQSPDVVVETLNCAAL